MAHHTTAVDMAYVQDVRQFRIKSFHATRIAAIHTAFLTVGLTAVKVVVGAMRGEVLQAFNDLQLGDEILISDQQQGFAANTQQHQPTSATPLTPSARSIEKLVGCIRKQRVQLMTSSGTVVTAYVITPDTSTQSPPYVLLPRSFEPATQHCLIEVRDI